MEIFNMELKEAVKVIIVAKKWRKFIDDWARTQYQLKFNERPKMGYHYYTGFDIIEYV
jgi:hypothetical protein